MCGIAGLIFGPNAGSVSPGVLDRMVDALSHRGPDDRGCFVKGHIGIGMRRLSIIDVGGGHQPMSSPDGAVQVVYNGECYNHQDLRAELEKAGYGFRTQCDTEVVVHGYAAWGIAGLIERMNGIYAFCIADLRQNKCFVVRDRIGVKPLYYIDYNGRLAFSSELRSVAASGLVRGTLDQTALRGYLTYQFTPADRTLLAGIQKLPPGHYLEWHAGRVRIARYWNFPNAPEDHNAKLNERVEALRALLWDTVRRQMMADVPIGCFLSGGLDSTIVACMMAKTSNHAVRTFSISFPDTPDYNEAPYFERLSREIGARHETIPFSEKEVIATLDEFAWAMDEPVADPAMLPTYLLSRAAGRELKVVLTGEGADEVFAGYPYYRPFVFGSPPAGPDQLPHRLMLADALRQRLGQYVPPPRNDAKSDISHFPYALDPAFIHYLLHPDHRPSLDAQRALAPSIEREAMAGLTGLSPLQAALALDTKVWLAHNLMPKLDKMTMAHSLEGRVPFLDHRLVEFAFTLPAEFKVGPQRGKVILREAVRGIIPDWMIFREKQGFNVPLQNWFRGPLREFAREALLGGVFARSGWFHPPALEALLVTHCELNYNVARPLWVLICLARWYARMLEWLSPCADAGDRPMEVASSDRYADPRAFPEVADEPLPLAAAAPSPDELPDCCDIVVPVYEGVNYVRDLLTSLARWTEFPYRVLLIDDSARDETHRELERLVEGEPYIELHRNDQNAGFLESANRGLAMCRAEFICLMNSDTLATPGWLERMVAAARSDPRVAMVNPLSNSCVNLSVPMPPGMNLTCMARTVAERSRRRYPDITTGVGFCLLLRRRYLKWLGGFDPVFGQGYCEESDMCMRYTEAGLRVVAADDAFVYHKGCGSFGTWLERYEINRKIFDARWQDAYASDYHRFLERNPLQYMRDRLYRHTIRAADWNDRLPGVASRSARRIHTSRLRGVSPTAAALLGLSPAAASDRMPRSRTVLDPPRTPPNAEQRELRYPTPPYLDRLPSGDGMRITFLLAEMPVAGGITSIVQLARELLLNGHDVRLISERPFLEPERFNLPCQPLIFRDRDELIRHFPASDIVMATFWETAFDYLPALRERYDFVSGYFVQDYEAWFYPESDQVRREKVIQTYAMSEYRIVKSRWLKELIETTHGMPCHLVHLGLDLGTFRNRHATDALGDPPRIMSIARPTEERRGFREAVETFAWIRQTCPDAEFVFLGTAAEQMPALPFPYINAGRIHDLNRVAELIGSCDVLIDSSHFQGFGRPGIEAMACGTACVLTSAGGVGEYARHEENCLLVKPRRTLAMANSVLRLLEDDPLRTRLRRAGRETAARFCHVDEARQHMALYRQWIDEKQIDRRSRRRARTESRPLTSDSAPAISGGRSPAAATPTGV